MSTSEDPDFRVERGQGQSHPIFPTIDLFPAEFDDGLGSTPARLEYEAANAAGLDAHTALVSKRAAWSKANPETGFATREGWLFAMDQHLAKDTAALAVLTVDSVRALRAYRNAQRANGANLRDVARAVYADADAQLRAAFATVVSSFNARETAMRLTGVRPDGSGRVHTGHFTASHSLGMNNSALASFQLDSMRVVVEASPRALIANAVAATK